jgi:hypothetical protein
MTNKFHCGACGTSCGDQNICTADACAGGMCGHVAGIMCDDSDVCTEDKCDPMLGCQSTPYLQPQLEALCVQLGQVMPGPGDCVFCDNVEMTDGDPIQQCDVTPLSDGVACTVDSCQLLGPQHTPDNTLCMMNQTCDITNGCVP